MVKTHITVNPHLLTAIFQPTFARSPKNPG